MTSGQLGTAGSVDSGARSFALTKEARSSLLAIEGGGLGGRDGRTSTVGALLRADRASEQPDSFQFQLAKPRLPRPHVTWHAPCEPTLFQDSWPHSRSVAVEAMIRQLLARHRILAARKLVQAVPSEQAVDEPLRRLRVVLAQPVVRRRVPARVQRSGDIAWLRRNARNYSGKWVALVDGTLLAAEGTLAALRRRLRERAPDATPFLHRL